MVLETIWWKKPYVMKIHVSEYQLYDLTPIKEKITTKRRLLCKSTFHFYADSFEDDIVKLHLTIEDDKKEQCFEKVYSQVTNKNIRFYTKQLRKAYILFNLIFFFQLLFKRRILCKR